MIIAGFDPGRDKCGIAVMESKGKLLYHQVVIAQEAINTIESLLQKFAIDLLVMGNQTTSKQWQEKLNSELPSVPIVKVDERNSSLEARDRYWQMYPPQGLNRLIPVGMRLPPRCDPFLWGQKPQGLKS